MVDIEVLQVNKAQKVEAIRVVREVSGLSLSDAKVFVEGVMGGINSNVLIQVPSEKAQEVIRKLSEAGMSASGVTRETTQALVATCPQCGVKAKTGTKCCPVCGYVFMWEKDQVIETYEEDEVEVGEIFTPAISADEVQNAPREKTMQMLDDARKIAEEAEYYAVEIPRLQNKIAAENKRAEEMRTEMSTSAKVILGLIAAVVLLVVFFNTISFFIAAIIGAVVLFIAYVLIGTRDLEKHKDENNARADKYIIDSVKPMEAQLEEITRKSEIFDKSGKAKWAKDIVGEDLFYSACIADLYNLIKSRRADSLKEALNKYDDEMHKRHMEEMQKAIQNASEVSAKEAAKQTAQLGEIEKNTRRAANAARSAAASSFGTYMNTKKK